MTVTQAGQGQPLTRRALRARGPRQGSVATVVAVVRSVPEIRRGLGVTALLAVLATAGRVVVPLVVQRVIDDGLLAPGGPDLGLVRLACLVALGAVVLTGFASYAMNVRIFRATESGLAALRVRAFRRVHDLSALHQQAERRGTLVSRVTGDIDAMSAFMQWGGLLILLSALQLLVATLLMLVWSWPLTLLAYACFVPLVLAIRVWQPRLQVAYGRVRERMGVLLGAISEALVGHQVITVHGAQEPVSRRVDEAVVRTRQAQTQAQRIAAGTFSAGELVASVAMAAVVVVGVLLGVAGELTTGRLVGFLFLVTLFVQPVQVATEILNEAQNAIAGMRRVLEVLEAPTDVADPRPGVDLPSGPVSVSFRGVGFAYPEGPPVLHDVDLDLLPRSRVAVVGETGSGKSTIAKLLARLMDPTTGEVLLSGTPLRDIRFASLRRRVVLVPQDGFLYDDTVLANVAVGDPGRSAEEVRLALDELGLSDWVDALPEGLLTPVGERGEALSVGERQLVAIARAYLADPDLLVLDEATSAVDPATEVRLQRALDSLTRGRTTVTIAHRLSTAEAADEVLVVDAGRVVQRGPHAALVEADGPYAALHRSWVAQART